MPVNTVILKVAAPCNLNCSYCYEYNRGNNAWRLKPTLIDSKTLTQIGERIAEYCSVAGIDEFHVNLHGGEPLLLGAARLREAFESLRSGAPGVRLHFGVQTNATLVTDSILDVCEEFGVAVGVSIDGNAEHNRWRVDHKGDATYEKIVEGLNRVRARRKVFSGLLAVVDLGTEPEEVLSALAAFEPPSIDLLPPFGNYDNPPFAFPSKYSLGDWMVRAFGHWMSSPRLQRIRIRYLEDAMVAVISGESRSDWFGVRPPGYFVIATDGAYEGLDTLKVAGDESARTTGLTILNSSLGQFLTDEVMTARSKGIDGLCEECQSCPIVGWCGGGYLPTRYGRGKGYDNPSFFCADMKTLFTHIGRWASSRGELDAHTTDQIRARCELLERLHTASESGV